MIKRIKISQLPAAGSAQTADQYAVVQGAETRKQTQGGVQSLAVSIANAKVASVSGDLVDNSDPLNPIIQSIANLTFFATTAPSDIANYTALVTNITAPDYDEPAVPVATGTITVQGQLVGQLAGEPGVFVGNPGVINITTAGEIRRTSGTGSAEFYFEAYLREQNGTETLLGTSNRTVPVTNAQFAQFSADCLLNNGVFTSSDRLVLKFYADRIGSGSNPNYEFLFGGANPVNTRFPVAASLLAPTGKIRRHSFDNPFSYCGFANFGASENSPTWTITRIEYLSGGATVTGVATGAWTNRVNLIYT
jgi:hypothetical protein